jgi:gp16 family phage-associated protein
MTLQQLKEKFAKEGKTFSGWSKENGVKYSTTLAVINGTNKGNYGEAHRVAVALGLKEAA